MSTPTRDALLADLRSSGDAVLQQLRALPTANFDRGCYENGWTARQVLAHVAAIEWSYPRLLEIAATPAPSAGDPPTRTAQGGIDAYNARQVEKRAEASIADLLAEFARNRAALVGAVQGADEARLATPIRSAGGVTGTVAEVLRTVAVGHVLGHLRDITGA
ncbi:MAG: DinB family protein [Chloroflexi bacterium]|nr:DinB family protein [Chloroflexota bacterium]